MGSNVDKYLELGEHAAIDHTGIPGVGAGGGGGGEIVPPGVIMPFGGAIADVPVGYLPCDGSVVSQATYPALFTAIGATWDTGGEGGGNFRLPDFRGRSPVGLNDGTLPNGADGGLTARTAAQKSGAEGSSHTHSPGSFSTNAAGDHSHPVTINAGGTFLETNLPATYPGNDGFNGRHTHTASTTNAGNHAHSVTAGVSGSANPTNMSPFAVAAFIIKAVEVTPSVIGIGSDTLPTGTITPYAGTIAAVPVGFLPCDGALADQVVEAGLFAVIGTAWNTGGEPGGFFRLPDLRGKSIVGLNDGTLPAGTDGGFTTRNLADLGGEEDHTTTQGEMPSHSHPLQNFIADFSANSTGPSGGGSNVMTAASSTEGRDLSLSNISESTSTTGGNGAHNTMQPFAVCSYIIKSRQIGGGIGVTAQNNGGPLTGSQPTLNFIPSGLAGVTVVENVPQNRLDITISAAEVFDSAAHALVNHTGLPGIPAAAPPMQVKKTDFGPAVRTTITGTHTFTPKFAIWLHDQEGFNVSVGFSVGVGQSAHIGVSAVGLVFGKIGLVNWGVTVFNATTLTIVGTSHNMSGSLLVVGE